MHDFVEKSKSYIYIYIYIYRSRSSGLLNLITRQKLIRILGSITTFCFLLLTFLFVFPIINHQETVEASYTPAVSEITITSASNIASVDIIPNSSVGTFASSSLEDEVAFAVTTTNLTGYSLTVGGSAGDISGQLVNTNTSSTIDTLVSATSEATFANGDASTYNNKWGIKSSKYNTSTSDWDPLVDGNYLPAPTNNTVVIDTTSKPNTTANNYRLGIGARVDYTKPSGTYTNTYILQAIGNQISYSISYSDTSSDASTVTPTLPAADAHSNITASEFILDSTIPTRANWVFIGWCDGTVSHPANNNSTCSGTVYQPGDNYVFPNIATPTTTLVAMWGVPIQNLTTSLCTTTARTVYDTRDRQGYIVQKLADGNCWLLDNLRLGSAPLMGSLSATNTNILSSNSFSLPASSATGFNSYTTAIINTDYANTIAGTTFGVGSGKIGAFYNYCTASAGTYCYTSGSGEAYNVTQDICPAGWRMPIGGSTGGESQNLYVAYSSNVDNFINALSLPMSGMYHNSDVVGSNNLYWSSSFYSNSSMFRVSVGTADVWFSNTTDRDYGLSVRCVRKTTMQDFDSTDVAALSTGSIRVLTDSRDGENYVVSKLADGKIWMLDNLNLDLTKSTIVDGLSDANTNASNTTLNYLKNGGGSTSNRYPTVGLTLSNWSTSVSSYSAPLVNTSGTCSTTAYNNCTYDGNYSKDMILSSSYRFGKTQGKVGTLYNYCATSAGYYCFGDGSSTGSPSGNATQDICPAGWRLPTGGASGEYQALYTAYSSNEANYRNAISSSMSGYYHNTSSNIAGGQGYYALYWTSTNYNAGGMQRSVVYIANAPDPIGNTSNARSLGFSIRCIKK